MGKTRVMHIITRMILGGAQENTLLTCRGLHERPEYEVHLVTGPALGPEGELLTEARRLGLDVTLVPSMRRAIHPWRDLATVWSLRRIIRALEPDIVHTHSSKAGILGRYAAHAERVPAILHTIHGLPFHPYESWWRNALYVRLERMCAKWSSRIISVADAMTEQALAAGVGRREQFVTIYSGMEVEPFLTCGAQRAAMRAKLGFSDEQFVIGKVARLFELKGYEDVLEAAPRILAAHPNVRFLFVGDGILRERLEAQAAQMGIREKIVFAGLVPARDVPSYLSAMDALVHASLREGLARVLPQALLAGKPVVSFDVDGAREVVIEGETGHLVPPRSVDGLVAGLLDFIERPDGAAAMAERGRELCRERFGWRKMVGELDRLYRELLVKG
jgi:glycosyltransferase involved in cell wall biosynthesis